MECIKEISDLLESNIFSYNNFGFDFQYERNKAIDKKAIENGIRSIYQEDYELREHCRYNPEWLPIFIMLKSPMACQLAALTLKNFSESLRSRGEIKVCNCDWPKWKIIEVFFIENWERSFRREIQKFVSYFIWKEVWSKVRVAIKSYVENERFMPSYSWNIETANLNQKYENELVSHGVFEMVLLKRFCIISELPTKIIKNKACELHSSKGSAIRWRDGFELYFWNGVNIHKEWIINKETITKETILSEHNIERRRCLMEIIGNEKYLELLNVVCIDEAIDDYKKPIKLFRTKDRDTSINEWLYYLFVVDPSTNREYYISVPPSYDVHWAKASTFNHEKIQYRHGDVGLLNLDNPCEQPIIET